MTHHTLTIGAPRNPRVGSREGTPRKWKPLKASSFHWTEARTIGKGFDHGEDGGRGGKRARAVCRNVLQIPFFIGARGTLCRTCSGKHHQNNLGCFESLSRKLALAS